MDAPGSVKGGPPWAHTQTPRRACDGEGVSRRIALGKKTDAPLLGPEDQEAEEPFGAHGEAPEITG